MGQTDALKAAAVGVVIPADAVLLGLRSKRRHTEGTLDKRKCVSVGISVS